MLNLPVFAKIANSVSGFRNLSCVNSRLFTLQEVDYFSRMKYENSIVIQLPVARVIELFDNPDNMQYWQKGLQSFEHVSGTP